MKIAVLLSAIAGASAFAPASQSARVSSSALNAADLSSMRGVGPETGGRVFDPLDLAQYAPLDFLRKAELSNGRSAMLATVGWSFPTFWTFPDGPVDTTDPIEAFFKADPQWWAQFIIFCATIEGIKYRAEMDGKSYTGEIGKEAAIDWTGNWSKLDDAQKEDMAIKELKNGRLAMIGMAGYFASVLVPGSVPALS
ncbi:chlorophyll A-B binding protein [Nitzschia inconspicua]|uniref:Chlorophyll A-B binding protein n=1 Tax=Nitzschia inconspicua TaxID=303405 RepID=A0A9K3Q5M3_9STRA|nr:chlorophyll A-B binding protein [Nitzschia inconspicua]